MELDTYSVLEKVTEVMSEIILSESLTEEDTQTYRALSEYALSLSKRGADGAK